MAGDLKLSEGSEPRRRATIGLTGMRERADAIGGTLEVTSEPGTGTTVRLQVITPKEAKGRSGE